jgi:hypothetical protein
VKGDEAIQLGKKVANESLFLICGDRDLNESQRIRTYTHNFDAGGPARFLDKEGLGKEAICEKQRIALMLERK